MIFQCNVCHLLFDDAFSFSSVSLSFSFFTFFFMRNFPNSASSDVCHFLFDVAASATKEKHPQNVTLGSYQTVTQSLLQKKLMQYHRKIFGGILPLDESGTKGGVEIHLGTINLVGPFILKRMGLFARWRNSENGILLILLTLTYCNFDWQSKVWLALVWWFIRINL